MRLMLPRAAGRLHLVLSTDNRSEQPFVGPLDGPELPMIISFEGISPAEQRVALAAFPGGKRFVLKS